MIVIKFKGFLKEVLLTINPLYRKINSNQEQLENIHRLININSNDAQNRLENIHISINNNLNETQNKLVNIQNLINYQFCNDDESYIHADVPQPKLIGDWLSYLCKIGNKKNMRPKFEF